MSTKNQIDKATAEFYHAIEKLHCEIAEKHKVARFLVIRDHPTEENTKMVCAEFKPESSY